MYGCLDWSIIKTVEGLCTQKGYALPWRTDPAQPVCLLQVLKGQCHKIFVCWFFHQIAPPGPIRGTLGRFWFFLKIHGDIWQKSWLSGVWYTLEWWIRGVRYTAEWQLCGVSYTTEWWLGGVCIIHHGMVTQRCILHRGNDFKFEYLREFLVKIEIALGYLSGDQEELFDDNYQHSKISWHCPFKV